MSKKRKTEKAWVKLSLSVTPNAALVMEELRKQRQDPEAELIGWKTSFVHSAVDTRMLEVEYYPSN